MGKKKAIVAVAHSLLGVAHMRRDTRDTNCAVWANSATKPHVSRWLLAKEAFERVPDAAQIAIGCLSSPETSGCDARPPLGRI
jgi:hypothetical protein